MVDLLITGSEGKIHAKYNHNNNDKSPIVIILHPDPLRGGTMNTKIVFELYKMFSNNGFSAIRFNFRGVGKSEGIFDDGEGELTDSASVLDWLQQHNTNSKICWVAGFSFGSWVAMQLLMRRPEINGFVCISPPANIRDFSFLAPCPSSGLIINGEKEAGFSFFSFTPGMDDGPVWAQGKISIGEHDYIFDILQKLEEKVLEVLDDKFLYMFFLFLYKYQGFLVYLNYFL